MSEPSLFHFSFVDAAPSVELAGGRGVEWALFTDHILIFFLRLHTLGHFGKNEPVNDQKPAAYLTIVLNNNKNNNK